MKSKKFYSSPTPKLLLGAGVLSLLALIILLLEQIVVLFLRLFGKGVVNYKIAIISLFAIACIIFIVAIIEFACRSDRRKIQYLLQKKFCNIKYGNPLNLKEGQYLPVIKVFEHQKGYKIRISCKSAKFSDLLNLTDVISSYLDEKKFKDYAVIFKEPDIACNYVEYIIQNVVSNANKQSVYHSIEDIPSDDVTKRYINDGISLKYSTILNASALIVGRTRSGKTTGIISTFLLPTLKQGPDRFGSKVIIIDPKSAELSRCPFVLSPDMENGNASHILQAIEEFNSIRIKRQQIINKYNKKWFQIGMKPSILFIDEFVAFLDLFPVKSTKDNPNYCVDYIQSLLKQIATMGASAGCFLILSVAQASVGAGGISSIINNACGIRILFKPSKQEAKYLWSADKLETMNEREFMPGDAWWSADDGINNNVSFIKFPKLEFNEFEALSDLLIKYYKRN